MKVKRIIFPPGGMPQFWKGEEERRSRLEANDGTNPDMPKVELDFLPELGGYVRLMYAGNGPFYIGPHAILGIIPAEDKQVAAAPPPAGKK